MKKLDLKQVLIFLSLFTVSLLLGWFYRPYIYSNHIYDYHFADFFPNLFAIPVGYSFFSIFGSFSDSILFSSKNPSTKRKLLSYTGAILFYELIQIPIGGFDMFDVLATFTGAFLTYAVIPKKPD